MNAAQLQTLLDAGGLVQLPPGETTVENTLRIRKSGVRLVGDPSGTSVLQNTKPGGQPVLVVAPQLPTQPVLFAANPGAATAFVNLRDVYSAEISGLNTLSIVFNFNVATMPPAGSAQVILVGSGRRCLTDAEKTRSTGFDVFNGKLRAWITTLVNGVKTTTQIQLPITVGTHAVDLVYNSPTMMLTIDGVSESVPATGTVFQGFYESLCIGSELAIWPLAGEAAVCVPGVMTDFVMTGDGVVLVSIPSFVCTDQLIPITTSIGPGALFVYQDGVAAPIANVQCKDFTVAAVHNHGVLLSNCTTCLVDNVTSNGRMAVTLWNNAYTCRVQNSVLYSILPKAQYALGLIGNSACTKVENIQALTAGVGFAVFAGQIYFDNCWTYGGTMRVGLLARCDGGAINWTNGFVSTEGQSAATPPDACLIFSGYDTVKVLSGGSYLALAAVPAILFDKCGQASIDSHQVAVHPQATSAIRYITPNTSPATVQSSQLVPRTTAVPWGN